MDKWREGRGQSLTEMAIILPILLLLLYGVVEAGFALRNYLVVSNANREAARFAARGRFEDGDIAERLVSAGGVERITGVDVPFLRTGYATVTHPATPTMALLIVDAVPNTGIIITRLAITGTYEVGVHPEPVPESTPFGVVPIMFGLLPGETIDDVPIEDRIPIPGTVPVQYNDEVKRALELDSMLDRVELVDRHVASTVQISQMRKASLLQPLNNDVIVVETFYMHYPLGMDLWDLLAVPTPWLMYAKTEIRLAPGRAAP